MADSYPSGDDSSQEEADESKDVRELGDDGEPDADDQDDKKDLAEAKACLKIAEDAEMEIRRLALEDIEFSIGEQWDDNVRQERERDGRPCLVINRIPQFIQQISNDQRQNRPSIKVHPVGSGADVDTAKIIQGIVRHIEYNSNADVAYDTAFDAAVRGSFGYWRVVTDYVRPDSFDQDIFIRRIKNQFSVYLDPSAQEPDGSDANWGLILDWLTREEYEKEHPDSELISLDWEGIGNQAPGWMKNGAVCVAEYFRRVWKDETVHLLSTGVSVTADKLEQAIADAKQAGLEIHSVRSRKTKIPSIKWLKLNAVEILDRTEWIGKYIPIVPVYGGEVNVDGKRVIEGIVRNAKDPQRMLNYWKSAETEAIALAPRAPFIAAEGQTEGYEADWASANRRNHSVLKYKPTTIAGQAAPPPQRQSFEPAVQAITQAAMQAADDLKATTGIYDPSLGAGSPDTSGIAIQRRNTQAQTSNFHLIDNLTRALKHTGKIVIDLIPKIYDTARATRIIGDDGEQKIVTVNKSHQDENGEPVLYQLDAGTYDVSVDVGPSYASKRQEASASMQSLAQSYPKVMDIAGDLFVKNMDWPGAQDIAERIKKTLPPQLTADTAKGPQQVPPQVQAQMQQMGQMIDQLTKNLHEASFALETKQVEHQSRERIEMARIQADIEINLAKMQSGEAMELLKQEVGSIHKRLQLLGFDQPPPDYSQSFAPQPAGAPGAPGGQGAPMPTGGPPPGQPMEGNP